MSARESFAGFVVIGDALNAPFITDATVGVAAAPTGTPAYSIYSADLSTALVSAQNATQLGGLTGVYYIPETISSGSFEAGKKYVAIVTYVIAATTYTKTISFNTA